MRPTDSAVADVVGALQAEGFPSLVLTSRGIEFRLATHREMRRNGLDFTRTAPSVPPGAAAGDYMPYEPDDVTGFTPEEIDRFQLIRSSSRPRTSP